jgi:hypothetical protein
LVNKMVIVKTSLRILKINKMATTGRDSNLANRGKCLFAWLMMRFVSEVSIFLKIGQPVVLV